MNNNNLVNKCPYCGGTLIEGTLYTCKSGTAYWLPDGQTLGLFYNPIKDKKLLDAGSIIFHTTGLGICEITSQVCKECKKLIIDYSNSNAGPTVNVKER